MSSTTQDEDDWEYEYSPAQTSAFYIPLDLSNVPSTHTQTSLEKRPGHPTLLKSRLRALEAARAKPSTSANPENPDADANEGNGGIEQEQRVAGEIQITGLHTANPLMMYNGELLSCHWSQTIGTDMFFVKDAKKDEEVVLRELNGVDLLAFGSAKLVARVARLRPKDELFDGDDNEDGGIEGQKEKGSGDKVIEDGYGGSTAVGFPSSSKFLSKLNEAKLRRGERNRLLATQTPEGVRLSTEMVASTLPASNTGAREQQPQEDNDVAMGGT